MKKSMLLLFALLNVAWGVSQEILYANESHVVTLFFPSPIRQAVTGAENFTFSYNRENGQRFGLLQANRGGDSNLLVITQDGSAYSYGLAYRKNLLETYRFVQIEESIWKEKKSEIFSSVVTDSIPKTEKSLSIEHEIELMMKGAEYLMGKKSKTLRTKRKYGLILRLKELFYHSNKVYLKLEIQNNSTIDFEMGALEIYKVNGSKGRRSSYQKLELKPVHKHREPSTVSSGHGNTFVYVVPKFTLGDVEKLLVELYENKGNRMLRLYHK